MATWLYNEITNPEKLSNKLGISMAQAQELYTEIRKSIDSEIYDLECTIEDLKDRLEQYEPSIKPNKYA